MMIDLNRLQMKSNICNGKETIVDIVLFSIILKEKNSLVVSTELVDNESERERYAQTQKQIQKKDDKWRNAKSTMPKKFSFC